MNIKIIFFNFQYDERDTFESFKQFYQDTLPEFRKAGTVVQFKVKIAVLLIVWLNSNQRCNIGQSQERPSV